MWAGLPWCSAVPLLSVHDGSGAARIRARRLHRHLPQAPLRPSTLRPRHVIRQPKQLRRRRFPIAARPPESVFQFSYSSSLRCLPARAPTAAQIGAAWTCDRSSLREGAPRLRVLRWFLPRESRIRNQAVSRTPPRRLRILLECLPLAPGRLEPQPRLSRVCRKCLSSNARGKGAVARVNAAPRPPPLLRKAKA